MKTDTPLSAYALFILNALQDRPMYAGTVSAKTKASRRAKNLAAKKSRKVNRGR